MRAGDFSGANFTIKDPLTGQPFPGNVIPANRIDPTAQKILNFFYPLPNQGTLSSGMGVYQQFVPETRNRHRADLRIDHEASKNDSLFLRGELPVPRPEQHPVRGGQRAHEPGDPGHRSSTPPPSIGGWTKIFSTTVVNEFRDRLQLRQRASGRATTSSHEVERAARPRERRRASTPDRVGFPSFTFSGGSAASRPTNIADGGRNVDRTVKPELVLDQRQPQLDPGRPLAARPAALWTRNTRDRRLRHAASTSAASTASTARATGNAFADFLLGYTRDAARPASPRRGDTRRALQRLRGLRPGRLEGQQRPDRLPGPALRARRARGTRRATCSPTSSPTDGGHHVVPNAEVAALLPPGLQALGRTLIADQTSACPTRSINADKNNFSPRVGFAWRARRQRQDRAARRLRALPPDRGGPGPARPAWPRTSSATRPRYSGGAARTRLLAAARRPSTPRTSATRASTRTSRAPDIYQYNLTLERELPRRPRPARELHRLHDAEAARSTATSTRCPPSTDVLRPRRTPTTTRGCPSRSYGYYMDNVENTRRGPAPRGCRSSCSGAGRTAWP